MDMNHDSDVDVLVNRETKRFASVKRSRDPADHMLTARHARFVEVKAQGQDPLAKRDH